MSATKAPSASAPGRTAVDEVAEQLLVGLWAQLPAGFRPAGFEVELGALVDLTARELHAALVAQLPGVEVMVTVVPTVYRCLDCGAEYPEDEFPCPACGSPNHEILHGNELQVRRAWGPGPG